MQRSKRQMRCLQVGSALHFQRGSPVEGSDGLQMGFYVRAVETGISVHKNEGFRLSLSPSYDLLVK